MEVAVFELNPYDPFAANKVIEGKNMTICWHVII